jgi:hypothetical protein
VTLSCFDWTQGAEAKTKVEYVMFLDDILLSLMFFRFYFLVIGLTMMMPTNAHLYSKRLANDAGFDPSFFFTIKACLMKYKA